MKSLPKYRCTPDQGFTLVELMIAIAIIGIVSAIAVPNFQQMVSSQRVKSAASDIYGSLQLARSEAMKRNSGTANPVSLTAVDSTDWSKGWTVGITGSTFQTQNAYTGNVVVVGPDSGTIAYLGTGRPNDATRADNNTPPLLKVSSSAHSAIARCISLSLSGMPEVTSC